MSYGPSTISTGSYTDRRKTLSLIAVGRGRRLRVSEAAVQNSRAAGLRHFEWLFWCRSVSGFPSSLLAWITPLFRLRAAPKHYRERF